MPDRVKKEQVLFESEGVRKRKGGAWRYQVYIHPKGRGTERIGEWQGQG